MLASKSNRLFPQLPSERGEGRKKGKKERKDLPRNQRKKFSRCQFSRLISVRERKDKGGERKKKREREKKKRLCPSLGVPRGGRRSHACFSSHMSPTLPQRSREKPNFMISHIEILVGRRRGTLGHEKKKRGEGKKREKGAREKPCFLEFHRSHAPCLTLRLFTGR